MAKIVADVDDFSRRMDERAKRFHNSLRTGTEAAVDYTLQKVPTPPVPSRAPMPFVSERQRLFVILSIQEGSMEVPYRRTGHMAGSITGEVRGVGKDWLGFIGTNVVYAPWVISEEGVGGRGPQASYHSGVWYTLQKVVRDAKEGIINVYKEWIAKSLE